MTLASTHQAYSNPNLPTVGFRESIESGKFIGTGDPEKLVNVVYQLGQLPDPPLRVPLGKDSVGAFKGKLESLKKDLDRVESWSDDIQI